MGTRLDLQNLLENILGSRSVYFQSPANVRMTYPAIRYSRKRIDSVYANDLVYKQDFAYELFVIYKDPDCDISTKISKLPMCYFDRSYVADNLYHDVFTLYF